MRKCVCKKCGREFCEDDSNPNIHYSQPANICRTCEAYEKAPVGGYIQLPSGEYVRKV
jgi:hypothetical protein